MRLNGKTAVLPNLDLWPKGSPEYVASELKRIAALLRENIKAAVRAKEIALGLKPGTAKVICQASPPCQTLTAFSGGASGDFSGIEFALLLLHLIGDVLDDYVVENVVAHSKDVKIPPGSNATLVVVPFASHSVPQAR